MFDLYLKSTTLLASLATLLALASSSTSYAAGDVGRGGDVFDSQCAECHSLKAGKNKKGPSLFAVIGRRSASIADFAYSDAMKQSGITWTPDKIEGYLESPKKVVPGGKMKMDAAPTSAEIADLLAFLATKH